VAGSDDKNFEKKVGGTMSGIDFSSMGFGFDQPSSAQFRDKNELHETFDQLFGGIQDAFGANEGGEKDKKKEKNAPMTLEELNAAGIIGPGQDPEDFKANCSDLHKMKRDFAIEKRKRLAGLVPESAQYRQKLDEFVEWAVPIANETFFTSKKLPGPLISGVNWYRNLRNDESEPALFDETTVYETDQFSTMILRQEERFRVMFNPGPWMEAMMLTYYSYLSSASYTNDLGLNVVICGPPSAGKSYITQRVATLFPPGTVRNTSAMTAKSFNTGGCSDEMYVNLMDEVSKFMIGADDRERGSDFESILKRIMTMPYTETQAFSGEKDTVRRETHIHYATHYGTFSGCYDGKLPNNSSPLGLRWTMITVNTIEPNSPDSIIDRVNAQKDPEVEKVKAECLHVQKLVSFFVQLYSIYIYVGIMEEPCMNAFKQYFHMYRESMGALGFVMDNQKNYNKQHGVARPLTIMYAAHMSLFSDFTREERFKDGKYVPFFDNPLYYIKVARAYLFSTRAIAAWTLSITRFTFGNPVGSQISSTVFRTKLARHIDLFDDSCFSSEFMKRLKTMEANYAKKAQLKKEQSQKHLKDHFEATKRKMLNRPVDDEDEDDEIDYDDDGSQAFAAVEDEIDNQLCQEQAFLVRLQTEQEKEELQNRKNTETEVHLTEAMRQMSIVNKETQDEDDDTTISDKRKRRLEELKESEASNEASTSSTASFESARNLARQQSHTSFINEDIRKAAIQYVGDKVPFARTYSVNPGDAPQLEVNYIDLTDKNEPGVLKVLQQIRGNFGSCKPSIEVLEKALKDLQNVQLKVTLLELDHVTRKIRVKLDPETNRPLERTQDVVKVFNNTRQYDPNGNPTTKRVWVLTHWVLQRHSLVSAVKKSIESFGFDCAVPGIVLTSIPKWISMYGKTSNRKREANYRVFLMVKITPDPTKPLIIRNSDHITAQLRESLAQTTRYQKSAFRTFNPAASSQVPAVRIQIEPEVMAAMNLAVNAGIEPTFCKYMIPQVLERTLFNRRFAPNSSLRNLPTFNYTETATKNAVLSNRSRLNAYTKDPRIVLSNADFQPNDPSLTQKVLDINLLLHMADSNIRSAYGMIFDNKGELRPYGNMDQIRQVAARIRSRYIYQPDGGACDTVVGSWDSYRKNAIAVKRRAVEKPISMDSIRASLQKGSGQMQTDDEEPDFSNINPQPLAPQLRSSELLNRITDERTRHEKELCEKADSEVTHIIQHERALELELQEVDLNQAAEPAADSETLFQKVSQQMREASKK
jgi:hypothetical protein